MKYELEIKDHLYKIFKKMEKKDKIILKIINKKVKEILEDPQRFKPLRAPMQHMRRVHIQKHFVLLYSINENTRKVILEEFAHHDKVYG
ncbi:MAG: type II toxin-antitoxin system mRNA interferase toxin, RelE/StbE family [Candidatus Aenigmarchaeota archaeon]|nr:type II toxin-antitoxin system mRNA interferase toxin, RelE/StbE family [Candidatus Aenigmarchaeota archaeon]